MKDKETANWIGRELYVDFTDILPSGKSHGSFENQNIVSVGVLPAEEAIVTVAKHRKGTLIADVNSVKITSPHRIKPLEDHYLFCSPWQIVKYEEQLQYKAQLVQECFSALNHPLLQSIEVVPSPIQSGYRTRIEFGVQEINGAWTLMLHSRDSQIPAPQGCVLASEAMNTAALSTMKLLQEQHAQINDIKSIVVRESKTLGSLIVGIYVFPDSFPTIASLPEGASSLLVFQADPIKLISVSKKTIQALGESALSENILGSTISYPFDAFFQNNIPLYTQALQDIYDSLPSVETVVDMYAGVGTIGLSLHKKAQQIIAYEIGESMVAAATNNAEINGITSYKAYQISDLNLSPTHLANADIVIVNPTRRGLNEDVIQAIEQSAPEYIVYLSCNYQTQARDIEQLQKMYALIFCKAYDFYPNTPHVETLVILQKQ